MAFGGFVRCALLVEASLDEMMWIRDATAPETDGPPYLRVRDLVPAIYGACCKLLHPMYRNADVEDGEDETVTWNDVRPQTPDELFAMLANGANLGLRIRWRDLAEKYGLTFHSGFTDGSFTHRFGGSWPRYLIAPDEGTLDPVTCGRLVRALQPFASAQRCYFQYELIATNEFEELVFAGELNDVRETFGWGRTRGSPTHWWPTDRSWIVVSDYDLAFTLIGGPASLITALIEDDQLECLELQVTDRIDYESDTINGSGFPRRVDA